MDPCSAAAPVHVQSRVLGPWRLRGVPGVRGLQVLADSPRLANGDVTVLERRDLRGKARAGAEGLIGRGEQNLARIPGE